MFSWRNSTYCLTLTFTLTIGQSFGPRFTSKSASYLVDGPGKESFNSDYVYFYLNITPFSRFHSLSYLQLPQLDAFDWSQDSLLHFFGVAMNEVVNLMDNSSRSLIASHAHWRTVVFHPSKQHQLKQLVLPGLINALSETWKKVKLDETWQNSFILSFL